jgi:hypothetical protein
LPREIKQGSGLKFARSAYLLKDFSILFLFGGRPLRTRQKLRSDYLDFSKKIYQKFAVFTKIIPTLFAADERSENSCAFLQDSISNIIKGL